MHKRIFKSMVGLLVVVFAITTIPTTVFAQAEMTPAKKTAVDWIEKNKDHLEDMAVKAWENAEVSYHEFETSKLYANELRRHGFKVRIGSKSIPTGVYATYGKGSPVIMFTGDIDAMPAGERGAWGHSCGHNLQGSGPMAAAIAVSKAMKEHGLSGTVKYIGTPAEELLHAKQWLIKDGEYDGVDVQIGWHASAWGTSVGYSTCNTLSSVLIDFSPKYEPRAAGHATNDAMVMFLSGIHELRNHLPNPGLIQYVIVDGGQEPNCIAHNITIWMYLRIPAEHVPKPERSETKWLRDQVFSLAEAAAAATQCNVENKILAVTYETLPIFSGQKVMYDNLLLVGAPQYTDEDRALAKKLGAGILLDKIAPPPNPDKEGIGSHSADDGDVSWVTPNLSVSVNTHGLLTTWHSKSCIHQSGTPYAVKGMIVAAKTMAATAIDLFTKPATLSEIKTEFKEKTKGFTYAPLFDIEKAEAFSPYLRYVANRYKQIAKEGQPGKFVETKD